MGGIKRIIKWTTRYIPLFIAILTLSILAYILNSGIYRICTGK